MSELADHILAKAVAIQERGDNAAYLSVHPDFPNASQDEFLDSVAELKHADMIMELGSFGPDGSQIVVTEYGKSFANKALHQLVKQYKEMIG